MAFHEQKTAAPPAKQLHVPPLKEQTGFTAMSAVVLELVGKR